MSSQERSVRRRIKVDQAQFLNPDQRLPDDHVLTPGGYRHRCLVHYVANGLAVCSIDDKFRRVHLDSGRLSDFDEYREEFESIPALRSGWITWASWDNHTEHPISSFVTTWKVPAAPRTGQHQTIFIFSSIEDAAKDDIVQPVLQWGTSSAGGGQYWSAGSWYVASDGHAFYSSLVRVNEGDVLTGNIELLEQHGSLFDYASRFEGIDGTEIVAKRITELRHATQTLEAYRIRQCSDYPAARMTPMTGINIRTGASRRAPEWSSHRRVRDCDQTTKIVSTEDVQIYYRGMAATASDPDSP